MTPLAPVTGPAPATAEPVGPGLSRARVTVYLQALNTGLDAHERVHRALVRLPALVPGCDHVSIAVTDDQVWEHLAGSDDVARRGDDLQHLLGDGPSLHAWRTGHSVVSHDLRRETRWPGWCDRASEELGLGTALSVQLCSRGRPVATLNLYGDVAGALSGLDVAVLHALADPLTAVLVEARLADAQRTATEAPSTTSACPSSRAQYAWPRAS